MEEVSQDFPKWKYHSGGNSTIVQSPEDEKALGSDWYDHPGLIPKVLPPVEGPVEEEAGITVSTDEPVSTEPKKRGRPKKVE